MDTHHGNVHIKLYIILYVLHRNVKQNRVLYIYKYFYYILCLKSVMVLITYVNNCIFLTQ